MEKNKVNIIITSIIASSTFLATLGAIIYYSIEAFNLKGFQLSLVGEIYILLNLLFIDWIKRVIK